MRLTTPSRFRAWLLALEHEVIPSPLFDVKQNLTTRANHHPREHGIPSFHKQRAPAFAGMAQRLSIRYDDLSAHHHLRRPLRPRNSRHPALRVRIPSVHHHAERAVGRDKQGQCRPVIHAVFPLDQAAQAHTLMGSSQHIGKIMLEVKP